MFRPRRPHRRPDRPRTRPATRDPPAGTTAVEVRAPEFLGPQTGSIALDIRARVVATLCHLPGVRRACFCRLQYSSEDSRRAAVCVTCEGDERAILAALAAVCSPFYAPERSPHA
jgi:hypothetical protein